MYHIGPRSNHRPFLGPAAHLPESFHAMSSGPLWYLSPEAPHPARSRWGWGFGCYPVKEREEAQS